MLYLRAKAKHSLSPHDFVQLPGFAFSCSRWPTISNVFAELNGLTYHKPKSILSSGPPKLSQSNKQNRPLSQALIFPLVSLCNKREAFANETERAVHAIHRVPAYCTCLRCSMCIVQRVYRTSRRTLGSYWPLPPSTSI